MSWFGVQVSRDEDKRILLLPPRAKVWIYGLGLVWK